MRCSRSLVVWWCALAWPLAAQVQSTWFPLIDRNPQTYVANIFRAKDSDYHAATQRIYRSPRFASYVRLPVGTP